MRLKNKVAIITGAGQGIGKAIALEFAKEGAKVVVSDLNQASIDETVKEVKGIGADAMGIVTDVSSASQVQDMVKKVLGKFKTVDVLVNNAGIYPFVQFDKITEAQWDKVIDVNLKGSFNCIKAVSPAMTKQKSGKIVNIASIAGAVIGYSNLIHYCASKGGVLGLTRATALELAPHINVNAIAPGAIKTPGTCGMDEKTTKQLEQAIPSKRMGEPKEIATAAVFLASDDSSYVTGQMLVVDGGWTMQ